jgi:NAD(P)H-dependent flavin oxidoreductase YrpB (nitropropane dioxygenase family)
LSRQEIFVERTTNLRRCRWRNLQREISSCIAHVFLSFRQWVNKRFGAQAVWVGTRFVCAKEAGAPKSHQQAIIESTYDETIRTLIFTGRPLRVRKNPYIMNWETERREEMQSLLDSGVLPVQHDLDTVEKLEEEAKKNGHQEEDVNSSLEGRLAGLDLDDVERPYLMGEVAAAIKDVKSAKDIIDEMIKEAIQQLRLGSTLVEGSARL